MRQLQPVLWNKGDLLQAQHLQTQDLYLESQLKFFMESLCGYPYGFETLSVDAARLATGSFGVSTASGVFPDGLLFDIPASDHEPEARPLANAFREGQPALMVSLGVPQYRVGVANVSFAPQGTTNTRFVADWLNLRDETSGLNEKPVQIARKNLRYLLPQDDASGYSVLPVARVVRKGDRLEFDHSFVPPLLHVSGNGYLVSIVRKLAGLLAAKSQEQSQNRRIRNQGITEYTASDTQSFWLLYTVNLYAPLFRHFLNAPGLHPHELYAQMLTLAGALTAFTLKLDPNELPPYDHDDLGTCFTQLDAQLRELLDTAIPRYFVTLPLKPTEQPFVYSASIPEDRFLVDTRIYLNIAADMKPDQLLKAAPAITKIASSGQIQQIINSATSGVRIARPAQVPAVLPMRLGYQCFQLDTSGPFWQGIVKSRNIAVYVPNEIPGPSMELVILLKTQV
jgi:type VI secretion system protein ImpJ